MVSPQERTPFHAAEKLFPPAPRSSFLISCSNKRKQGSLEKWLILGPGLRRHRTWLECLLVPESKEMFKNTQ